jgi:UDP-N-acetylmuramyl pentapeptide synthase
LNVYNGINGTTIIDDGKTSNKEGFIMALDYLDKKFEGEKWVLTQGIIELGNERAVVYEQLAKRIVEVSTVLVSNDDDLISAVRRAKSDFGVLKVNHVNGFFDALKFNAKKDTKILIEGKLPQNILDQIIVNAS